MARQVPDNGTSDGREALGARRHRRTVTAKPLLMPRPPQRAVLPGATAGSGPQRPAGLLPPGSEPAIRQVRAPAKPPIGNLLLRLRPDLSAAVSIWPWQLVALTVMLSFCLVLAVLHPAAALQAALVVLIVPFLLAVLLRLAAVRYALSTREWLPSGPDEAPAAAARRGPDTAYPTYAVLVALYDEAAVIPGLVEALAAFDYPASRLAIRLVVEEKDQATQAAIRAFALPPHVQMVVVPDGRPRTKPRALNFALSRTPGEFVVIYDAEDLPEPDQLRRALAGFATAPPGTGCLQARLNIVNHDASWLSRQFTIEYTALFDCILPTLERHGIPIPLGGTSNHFRRTALEAALAWDPYNVTEDADLGIRFARFGLRVGIIPSTTWEEAPTTFRIWLGQRTRWLKGWMQTYLVHMRAPRQLLREIGVRQFVGFQLFMISTILAPIVHPWFYVVMAADAWSGSLFAAPDRSWSTVLWWLAVANLIAGYLSAMAIGALAVAHRRRRRLIPHLLLLPVYWLAISLAAYRAARELVVAPHHWQKTPHAARPSAARPTVTRQAAPPHR